MSAGRSFLCRSKSRLTTIPPVPIRPGRDSAAVVAAAVVGFLLVLSGLYVRFDDGTASTGVRVARATDFEEADPGPVVEAPEREAAASAPADPPPAAPTEPASPSPTATAATARLAAVSIAIEAAASPTATAAVPTASPTDASLAGAPRPAARAAPGAPVPILMYHYIRVNPDPTDTIGYGLSVPPPLFAAQMDFLLERGYRVVPMRRLEALLDSGHVPDEKTVVLTLDDGYRDAYTEAFPVLSSHGFGATMFVITDLIDNPRYLSVAQLKELSAAGIEIGSHSATHSDLPSLSPQRLRREVGDSRAALERILGGPVTSFCYPSGRNNAAVRAAVKEAGYASAVTVEPGLLRGREDRFAIPRVRVYGGMGIASLARAIGEPAPDPARWRTFLYDAPQPRSR
jgi:peptidoglycan/xylan/chitin deacetylase (PgdA/CDA1 family)